VYFGSRTSLGVTRYNQTVDNLIVSPVVDSLDLLPEWQVVYGSGKYFLRQSQNLNLGSVRNQGWTLQGTTNLGAITATGTYSWVKSRLIGITPRYRNQFPQYVVGGSFYSLAEHTYGVGLAYARGGTRIAYNLQGQGQVWAGLSLWSRIEGYRRLFADVSNMRYRINNYSPLEINPGYFLGDVNVSHQFTTRVEGLLQITNVTNSFKGEANDPLTAQPGRTTGIGLRMRF
jgi:hypothetical protein